MVETGRRYLAPTAQGTGDGLTVGNAAVASTRLTLEAALRAAAVADSGLKASGSPTDIAIEMCWRADLGPYTGLPQFNPTASHGGVSATRQLRHVSVDASGTEIPHEVTRDHATLTTTAIGEDDVVQFVGTRTADPRSALEKDRIINMGSVTRYATTLDRAHVEVAITAGQALLPDGTVHDYGTGAWNTGNVFELIASDYDFVQWDGFKWLRYQHVVIPTTGASGTTLSWTNNFFENIKGFVRNSTDPGHEYTFVVDGLYGRGWAQSLFRIDYGLNHVLKNLDVDAELIVGEPSPGLTQFATGSSGTVGFVTVDNFIARNCWDAMSAIGSYQQGDGVVGNRACHDIYVTNGIFENIGDGGIDTKSYASDPNGFALYVENVDSINCKRSFRVHGGNNPDTSGGGVFNPYYLKNCRSIEPWGDAHLQVTGGTITWENPLGGVAMTDNPSHADPQASKVTTAGGQIDHILVTLRDLIYDVNLNSPAADFEDNTSTYPTEAAAEAASTFRTLIQEVSGPGWEGDILVDGDVYDFSTLEITEGDTSRISVTDDVDSVLFSVIPSEIGDIVDVDPVTVDVTWRNTDGSLP